MGPENKPIVALGPIVVSRSEYRKTVVARSLRSMEAMERQPGTGHDELARP
jgi:hypothetical protein